LCKFFKDLTFPLPICHHDDSDDNDDPPQPFIDNFNQTEIVFVARKERYIPKESSLFLCHPYSDEPMTPCKNLLGYWVLRILVWLLCIFIMVGNGVVLVLIKSACGMKDWKIPHLLLLFQLTMADIEVGVYLGFLAVVDLKTFSQNNFYQLVLWPQLSCSRIYCYLLFRVIHLHTSDNCIGKGLCTHLLTTAPQNVLCHQYSTNWLAICCYMYRLPSIVILVLPYVCH